MKSANYSSPTTQPMMAEQQCVQKIKESKQTRPERTPLQMHCDFFDRNHDGLLTPWETFQGKTTSDNDFRISDPRIQHFHVYLCDDRHSCVSGLAHAGLLDPGSFFHSPSQSHRSGFAWE